MKYLYDVHAKIADELGLHYNLTVLEKELSADDLNQMEMRPSSERKKLMEKAQEPKI